jgi:predicted DsbA family dithiol-disulfide isomerase
VRIEKLKRDYDLDVRLVHFPLHPDTPAEGITLDALFGGRADDEARKARQARMKSLMDAEGLPYGERTHTYNSRLAQELGKWADTQQGGWAIHEALFKAYFVDGRNISDPAILVQVAQSAGLPAQEASRVLAGRSFSQAVDEDWTMSRSMGVTGVPTFAAAGQGVVGAQPYEVLERLVRAAGAQPTGAR